MTIIPSGIKGNAQENWKKQQIFLVDFDNTYKGEKLYKDNPRHISIEKILNYCKSIKKLLKYFMQCRYSSTVRMWPCQG